MNPQCAAKGNVLDLWAAHRNLTLYDAGIDLADTFHLDITPIREETTRNQAPQTNASLSLNEEAEKKASSRPTPLD